MVSMSTKSRSSRQQAVTLCSDIVDDDESRTSSLLTRLTHGVLFCWFGEDSRRVKVVDSCLEETGSQSQAQHFLRLQLQLVLSLTHPGERAVDIQGLRAEKANKILVNIFLLPDCYSNMPSLCTVHWDTQLYET